MTRLFRLTTLALSLLPLLAACGADQPPTATPQVRHEAPPLAVSTPPGLAIVVYDNGKACPAGCDAHVVFHPSLDGTQHAFAPAPGGSPLANRGIAAANPCGGNALPDGGRSCVICFDESDASCLLVTHRGSGPPPKRFDVTPAFLAQQCAKSGLPAKLEATCGNYRQAVQRLAAKINCFREPGIGDCRDAIGQASSARAEDDPRYLACKATGDVQAYNRTQSDPRLQRIRNCDYLMNQPVDGGVRISPAACREGQLAGQIGLACCSADPALAAANLQECGTYFEDP